PRLGGIRTSTASPASATTIAPAGSETAEWRRLTGSPALVPKTQLVAGLPRKILCCFDEVFLKDRHQLLIRCRHVFALFRREQLEAVAARGAVFDRLFDRGTEVAE